MRGTLSARRARTFLRWNSLSSSLPFVLLVCSQLSAQLDWVSQVRQKVAANDLKRASEIVSVRLAAHPNDLEAKAWHARILSWTGHLPEAEAAYQDVLRQAPNDADVLLGLADVLFWERKLPDASAELDRAEQVRGSGREIQERRTRVQAAMQNQNAGLIREYKGSALGEPRTRDVHRYSVVVGSQTDLFNYSDAAQTESIDFATEWSSHWTSNFSTRTYRRLKQTAEQLSTGVTYRLRDNQSLSVTFAAASRQRVAPIRQITVDYDRGTRLQIGMLKGLEITAHSSQVRFDGSQVLIIGGTAIAYVPRDWWLIFIGNTARSKFTGLSPAWSPSWSTKVSAPVCSRLRADVGFGIGAENYSSLDQIGRISAHTYTGGARYSMTAAQYFSAFVVYQRRAHGLAQMSIGGGYGVHF
jgi:hypothetical protein